MSDICINLHDFTTRTPEATPPPSKAVIPRTIQMIWTLMCQEYLGLYMAGLGGATLAVSNSRLWPSSHHYIILLQTGEATGAMAALTNPVI